MTVQPWKARVIGAATSHMANRMRVCSGCVLPTDGVHGAARGTAPCGRCGAPNCDGAIVEQNAGASPRVGQPVRGISQVPAAFMHSIAKQPVSVVIKHPPKPSVVTPPPRESSVRLVAPKVEAPIVVDDPVEPSTAPTTAPVPEEPPWHGIAEEDVVEISVDPEATTEPEETPMSKPSIVEAWRTMNAAGENLTRPEFAKRIGRTEGEISVALSTARSKGELKPDEGKFAARPKGRPNGAKARRDAKSGAKPPRTPRAKPRHASAPKVVLRSQKTRVAKGVGDPVADAIRLEIVRLQQKVRTLEAMLEKLEA